MIRSCPTCHKNILTAEARFCYFCGRQLLAGQDETTREMPDEGESDTGVGSTLLNEAEGTREMPEIEEGERSLPYLKMTAGESTRPLPDPELTADESTQPMPDSEDNTGAWAIPSSPAATLVDESTRSMPEADEERTMARRLSKVTVLDEATQPSLSPETPQAYQTLPETSGPDTPDFEPGYLLQERYRLDKILGQGGFGAAYLAQDLKLNRPCVVKRMVTQGQSRQSIARHQANFKREAYLLAELNTPGHPHIPEIYDYFTNPSGNYLVMKYIEGRNLKDVLNQLENRMPWPEAVRYASAVSSALHYMHTTGAEPVIHRDVKPANILLGDDGRVWLVDFGLAKADPVAGSDAPGATKASGSLGYTPLEQWFGAAEPASDVYALGVTLHHLVTGIKPSEAYDGKFNIRIIKERHGQLPPIRKSDRKLPKQLEEIVQRAVAADPAERPTPLHLQQQLDVLVTEAQAAALFTFKNGKSAKTVPELVDLCEENRKEAEAYLYNGDFERWFLLINRNDLAEAAAQAVKVGKTRPKGLEKFLKLILPNLFLRRVGKVTRRVGYAGLQALLIAALVLAVVIYGGSWLAGWLIQRSIGNATWDFYALDVAKENIYSEAFLSQVFAETRYFDHTTVDVYPDQGFNVKGRWNNLQVDVLFSTALRHTDKRPRLHLEAVNGLPLGLVGQNISAGINAGIDDAFAKGPFDLTKLIVQEEQVVFWVEKSANPNRPYQPPAQPAPTPQPTPTLAADGQTLVVVFNQTGQDISLDIWGQRAWDILAGEVIVIELPPGEYDYTVWLKNTPQIIAEGRKRWNADLAYRLVIQQESSAAVSR